MEKYYKFNLCLFLLKMVENELPEEDFNIIRRHSDIVSSSYFPSYERINDIKYGIYKNIVYNLKEARGYQIDTKNGYSFIFECKNELYGHEMFIHDVIFKFTYTLLNNEKGNLNDRYLNQRYFRIDFNKNIFDYLTEIDEKEYKKEIVKNSFI